MARINQDKMDALLALVTELKADLNALRADFRAHDHASSYTAATIRINGSADTITGTETSSAVAAALPSDLNHG
jgi:hypothetical protein